MKKLKIAVFFGGKSPEHEVSIISGVQVLNALNKKKYEVIPVYLTKEGDWILGDESFFKVETFRDITEAILGKPRVYLSLNPSHFLIEETAKGSILSRGREYPFDVAFPVFHGRYGEDGAFQGLMELADAPYVGSDVLASSVGMDKIVSKRIAKSLNIPVPRDNWYSKQNWLKNPKIALRLLMKGLSYPVFVKPSRLGSSIGITKVSNARELKDAIEIAFFYDSRVIVEEAINNAKEVNISLLGSSNNYEFSLSEQPLSSRDILTFADKYLSSPEGSIHGMASLKRVIPAPVAKSTLEKVKRNNKRMKPRIPPAI